MHLLINQLQKKLSQQPAQNWVILPIGIETILAILTLVTNEEAKSELLTILNVKEEHYQEYIDEFSKNLIEKKAYTESLSDFIKRLGISEESYQKFTRKISKDEIPTPKKIPFSLSSKTLIKHSSKYQLRTKTIKKIHSYFDTEILLEEKTDITISNHLKFNDKWKNSYQLKKGLAFHNQKDEIFHIEMIECNNIKSNGNDGTFYLKQDKFHAIRLPFEQSEYCFEIFLPFENQPLNSIQNELKFEKLIGYSSMFQPQNHYYLCFPKAKIENRTNNITELLKLIGVSQIFTLSDAFSPFTENNNSLFVNTISQNSIIDINENGVSAEAYTQATFLIGISKGNKFIEFIVNRPFLYLIRNTKTNSILFLGKYYQPSNNETVKITPEILENTKKETLKLQKEKAYWNLYYQYEAQLDTITLRGKVLLGLHCFHNSLKHFNIKNELFEHYFEHVWIILEDKSDWLNDKALKEEMEEFYLMLSESQYFKHLSEYQVIIDKYQKQPITTILHYVTQIISFSLYYDKNEFYNSSIVNALMYLYLNDIPQPNINNYLIYKGNPTDLGKPITKFSFDS